MNQEMMALYKQRGVNPASGCVPMLLTMPVLFAFYDAARRVDRAARRAVHRLASTTCRPQDPLLHHARADGRARCSGSSG